MNNEFDSSVIVEQRRTNGKVDILRSWGQWTRLHMTVDTGQGQGPTHLSTYIQLEDKLKGRHPQKLKAMDKDLHIHALTYSWRTNGKADIIRSWLGNGQGPTHPCIDIQLEDKWKGRHHQKLRAMDKTTHDSGHWTGRHPRWHTTVEDK